MKKVINISIASILSLMLFSCSASRHAKKPPKFQEVEREYLKPFNNKYLLDENGRIAVPDLVISHTIFYPSQDIKILGEFSGTLAEAENGVMYKSDSINRIQKVVYKNTPGTVLIIQRDRFGIKRMQVSFDEDDPDYTFWFIRNSNGKFYILETGHVHWDGSQFSYNNSWYAGSSVLLFQLFSDKTENNEKQSANGNRTGAFN